MIKKAKKISEEGTDLLKAFEDGEMLSVQNLEEEKNIALLAAKNTIAKTKPVSIRLSMKDLIAIQKKADEIGLPYQTLINLLVHQYSTGKIQLIL